MQAIHLHHQAPLLEGARQFVAEVLRLQREVGVPPPGTGSGKKVQAKGAMEINRALRELLNQQALRRTRRLGEEDPQAEKVRYALAAFADEVFLHQPWSGQEEWRRTLLETDLFHSAKAGEQLFEELEELLNRQSAAQAQLAAVYLLVLCLGFEGKYRGTNRKVELEEWRVRLATFLFSMFEEGLDMERSQRQLFPRAYVASPDMAEGVANHARQFASLRSWFLVLLVGLVGYVAVGHVIWHLETRPLRQAIEGILEATR